jgi:hypothetical protein
LPELEVTRVDDDVSPAATEDMIHEVLSPNDPAVLPKVRAANDGGGVASATGLARPAFFVHRRLLVSKRIEVVRRRVSAVVFSMVWPIPHGRRHDSRHGPYNEPMPPARNNTG